MNYDIYIKWYCFEKNCPQCVLCIFYFKMFVIRYRGWKFILDQQNGKGDYPIHLATWGGHKEVIKILQDHGSSIAVQNNYGQYPIHKAAFIGHLDVVKYLEELGSDIHWKDKASKITILTLIHSNIDRNYFIRK